MADEPTFTKLMFGKAWANWKRLFQSVSRDLLLGGLEALVGFGIFLYVRGFHVALDSALTAIAFTVAPIGITVILVFLWYLVIAPAELAYEASVNALKSVAAAKVRVPPAPPAPVNWAIYRRRGKYTVAEFSGILSKEDPVSTSYSFDRLGFARLLEEHLSRTRRIDAHIHSEMTRDWAIKWADENGFDVSHVK